jgi:hypothetical protein
MWKTFWSRRKLVHLVLMGMAIAGVMTIAGVVLRASRGAAAAEPVRSQKPVVVPQNVRFTIYPEGIHPATATVQKGLISIAIEDLAGTENGVVVERLNGSGRAIVGNVKRFERHWRGRAQFELTPGVYRLRVPDREIEEAEITVEP